MEDLTRRALERALQAGATYADVRVVRRTTENIQTKNGHVEAVSSGESAGFGVRVLADGAWGFASSRQIDAEEMERVAELAVRIARASALVKQADVSLAPVEPARGRFESPCQKDPFEVPLAEKTALLLDADAALRRSPRVTVSEATMDFFREEKTFASTEGSYLEQTKTESGAGVVATATGPARCGVHPPPLAVTTAELRVHRGPGSGARRRDRQQEAGSCSTRRSALPGKQTSSRGPAACPPGVVGTRLSWTAFSALSPRRHPSDH